MTQPASIAPCQPAGKPLHATCSPTGTERAIDSAELLSGRQAIMIDHLGMRYVLRATRSGKLILTK